MYDTPRRKSERKLNVAIGLFTIISFLVIILYYFDYIDLSKISEVKEDIAGLKTKFGTGSPSEPAKEEATVTLTLVSSIDGSPFSKNDVHVLVTVNKTQKEAYTNGLGRVEFDLMIPSYYTFEFRQGFGRARIYEVDKNIKVESKELTVELDPKGLFGYTNFVEEGDDRFNEENGIIKIIAYKDYRWTFHITSVGGLIKCPSIILDGDKIYAQAYLWVLSSKNLTTPDSSLKIGEKYRLSDEPLLPKIDNVLLFDLKDARVGVMNLTLIDCEEEVEPRVITFISS
jgi:hypothetical protein